ncbi:DUF423 domain-containing protein [Alicyclobacillus shizuokensis]|uniref:DUF423 domain-containing protein n=1 Tax=Alicyclobacillus shizuokensis TaxID=392014 RepID=UPI000832BF58|nr:DUF423 domain-containing protein [Alicyclobacillus shizuokensis]MCL6626130.1 DUF423 domain-containing protein [Alicyclobacillus shizuokensis]
MGFVAVGAIFGFLSVALGAFATHVLQGHLPAGMLDVFHTGAEYQMYHALALLAVGILAHLDIGGRLVRAAGWLFAIGIVLFSGSLYVLATSGVTVLGAVTPFGGVCLLLGWVFLIVAAVQPARR